jgi:hypothetical protein
MDRRAKKNRRFEVGRIESRLAPWAATGLATALSHIPTDHGQGAARVQTVPAGQQGQSAAHRQDAAHRP